MHEMLDGSSMLLAEPESGNSKVEAWLEYVLDQQPWPVATISRRKISVHRWGWTQVTVRGLGIGHFVHEESQNPSFALEDVRDETMMELPSVGTSVAQTQALVEVKHL